MNVEVVRSQLLAMRTQIDALIAQLGTPTETPAAAPQAPIGECPHPEPMRQSIDGFGQPRGRWRCRQCGHTEGAK